LLDEGDQISLDAQKALRNIIEEFASNTRFIITCNYLFKIIPALQSRTQIFNLIPPIEGVVQRVKEILQKENISITPEQKPLLLEHIRKNLPDVRRIINDIQKFSISGSLQIKNDTSITFVKQILDKITSKQDLVAIRKEIIENEKNFSNDYRNLQKQMFEVIFESQMDQETKTNCLLIVSKGLELDAFVVDKEINCFTTLINLYRNIS
jgi:DNA polymerase III delta prime subunit